MARAEVGDRVIAILSVKAGVVHVMGEGKYLGNLVPGPDVRGGEFFHGLGVTNPAIKLDNGETVWGFECWWGGVNDMKEKFKGLKWEVVPVCEYRPNAQDSAEGPDGKPIASL